ncbi:MAG: glycosyltransferase [Rhodocyclaceae bacterium]|nr:glycosyltransferase [Rhodocyclaceae bacterium]MDZ4216489.1 glycosyltransferase [Rhodocyclaceae bacterium]
MSVGGLLLVAYQCGPGMGSVSQIGWEWYSRLAAEQAVTLVTHVRNRAALEAAGAPLAGSEIIYIDTEWFAGPLYRLACRLFPRSEHSVFLVSSLDYFLFDFSSWRALRRRLAAGAIWSVLHRVTPVTLAAPTWLGRLGLPTVIGPLNSGLSDPQGFGAVMRDESTWLLKVRNLSRLLDAALGSSKRAARILTATHTTLMAIAPRHHARCRMMLENGVELTRFVPTPWPALADGNAPLRILFVGRLVPVKCLDLLLRALANLRGRGVPAQLTVVGDGPLRSEWEALATSLGIAAETSFVGAQPIDAVAAQMRACHVFCLPSVRESGGAVLLEAMASARPVIALNYGGPGEIVSNDFGALLPLHSPAQVVADLTDTLAGIHAAPEDWRRKGEAGRRQVEQRYSWPAKIAAAQHTYNELVVERNLSCC